MKAHKLFRRLEALYAQLPEVECQGRCQSFCGPISMSEGEAQHIEARFGTLPMFPVGTNTCPYLSPAGRCMIYARRPWICRVTFALGAPCPWGCRVVKEVDPETVKQTILAIHRLVPRHPPRRLWPPGWKEHLLAELAERAGRPLTTQEQAEFEHTSTTGLDTLDDERAERERLGSPHPKQILELL